MYESNLRCFSNACKQLIITLFFCTKITQYKYQNLSIILVDIEISSHRGVLANASMIISLAGILRFCYH